jgi:hypothetical protein
MPKPLNQIHPDQAIALCTREQAQQLVGFDHHTVRIHNRLGVMLTYEWIPLEEHAPPFVLTVVFRHADSHPSAPAEIQSLVDGLRFQIRGQAR